MQYAKPYTYFLNKPGGTTNVLYGSLIMLIPTIGQIVLLGYQAEVAEDLERDPDLENYPDLEFNRFIPYLVRGVWPFLMQLIGTAVLMALYFLAMGVGFVAYFATNEPWIGIVAGTVLYLPLTILGAMLLWPLTLHAQLSKGFHFGPALRFTSQVVRRLGGQLFVAMLLHMLISFPLALLGLLLCFVGVFPVSMVLFMAQEHYMIQLYRDYLDEGGEPIGGPTELLEVDEV